MAHAKAEDLIDLEWLLGKIRAVQPLKEKSLGCFYLKGKGILHFHVRQNRRYAHISDGRNWFEIELPNPNSQALQKKAFSEIQKILGEWGVS